MNNKLAYMPPKSCYEQLSTPPIKVTDFLRDQASFLHTVHPLSTHWMVLCVQVHTAVIPSPCLFKIVQ